ncbi:hypothetical protein BH09PAT4_BH09PAT4_06520 [soil metagenome]
MNTESTIDRAKKIAERNDAHRKSMTGCIVTRRVAELAPLMNDIFVRVRDFSDFNEDNDPYYEHDFGSFEILGIKIFWKIDYYDQELKYVCDPLDPMCRRQLIIMRAEEY